MRSDRRNDQRSLASRSVAVLRSFTSADPVLPLRTIAARADLPKPTASRICAELVELGLLERVDADYRLGLGLFELGQRAWRQQALVPVARPTMELLRAATDRTISLAVLSGTEVVYLERLTAPRARVRTPAGDRRPALRTGLGKAILAHTAPQLRHDIIAATWQPDRAHPTPAMLERTLRRVVAEGVAYDLAESGKGILCVAAPLFGSDGQVLGSISATGFPTPRQMREAAPMVARAASTISHLLGAQREAGPGATN
ncbi:IclR family transcriptional regulator [Naumannella cuiyingiana]|uniref:DNA-binding IclR family transcriptional regulator n=1 Tax=Naumannella cuiyingiana TaxID=1347891 RepID=A0A7Z0D6J1_9ACTN|nr:IclR family transcriptional regulator [Naumannella cuiyingiana]NYI69803.1 DNA-binding IclR family transcriptional regulator [Naumannella cuiyingiana]